MISSTQLNNSFVAPYNQKANTPFAFSSPYRANNVTDVEYINRVRDLYRTAIKVNKFQSATWIAWSKFEERLNNLGNVVLTLFVFTSLFLFSPYT